MSRSCDAYKCTAQVSTGRFLCINHWRMVPLENQRTINRRYRALRQDFAFLSDWAYLDACVSAITALAKAEGHPRADDIGRLSSYGRLLMVATKKKAAT